MRSKKFFLLLLRVLFLLLASFLRRSHAFKQSDDFMQNPKLPLGGCKFPERWEGTWFQSGVRQPIIIDGPRLSSKGKCLGAEGDKFLVVDDKGICFRCVVIHEKHANVLQYKETFCHGKESLPVLCGLITGDALLYSMFREDALPVPCPFRGPFTFTYNRGHGECRNPVSSIDVCTEDSRLLLSYQACPDIYGTESTVEELQCLAIWKEGSSRYLVGKVHHNHATSNEDRFRCFVYEKTAPTPQQIASDVAVDYRVAQSGDATCNGLFSATEGSRTMTLKRAPSLNKCRFPNWLANYQHWHSLDYSATYSFHHRNSTLRISNTSGLEMKVVCAQTKPSARDDTTAMLLAHFTMGCQSGYMCMMFYRRDSHVIEVQQGQHVRRQEDACLPAYFNRSTLPFITLVTSTLEARQCPYLGKFAVTGLLRSQRHARSLNHGSHIVSHERRISHRNKNGDMFERRRIKRVMDTSSGNNCDSEQFSSLVVGCSTVDTMEFHSDCPVTDLISAYSCHGRWEDNGTNYLITTPQSRSSHGAKRYCFIYREVQDIVHFSSSSDNCDRSIRPGVEGGLAFNVTNNGQCIEVNSGHQNCVTLWTLLLSLVSFILSTIIFQIQR